MKMKRQAGSRISVVIPARNEALTIGSIVETIAGIRQGRSRVVDDILVVDDGSMDGTGEQARLAGARTIRVDPPGVARSAIGPRKRDAGIIDRLAPGPGKGQALWRGVYSTRGDIVCFVDADIRNFDPGFVLGLVGPLLEDDRLAFVKGHYSRPYNGQPGEGGRVTELLVRPYLSLIEQDLAALHQPLAGEFSGRRSVLERIPFTRGYGVDVGMVMDIARTFGAESIAQSNLGEREHRNQPLNALSRQAAQVLHSMVKRLGEPLPLKLGSRYYLVGDVENDFVDIEVEDCPPLITVPSYAKSSVRHMNSRGRGLTVDLPEVSLDRASGA